MEAVQKLVEKFLYIRQQNSRWRHIVTCLAAAVVFVTTYALILPAITLSKPLCGLEEHQHNKDCYEEVSTGTKKALTCSVQSLKIHTHTADCYDHDGNLFCGYADFVVHTHDESCYDADDTLVCPLPEIEEHIHTEDCYAMVQEQMAESGDEAVEDEAAEGETVEDEAIEDKAIEDKVAEDEAAENSDGQTIDLSETQDELQDAELICGKLQVELHTHTDACWTDGVLTCGKLQVTEHTHTDDCFAQDTEHKLVCVKQEHTHTDECYKDAAEDAEAVRIYEGDDYTVAVGYGPNAGISDGAELIVSEYAEDSKEYQTRWEQAAELYGWTEEQTDRVRLFDIGFYLDGEEIEPSAEVKVTITYAEQEKSTVYNVIHFGEETELVDSSTSYEDGRQNVDFALGSFSDIMLLAVDTADLDGQRFALVNGTLNDAMLAEDWPTGNTDRRLDTERVKIRLDEEGNALVPDTANVSWWTFTKTASGANTYYISTEVDGVAKYLKLNARQLTLEDSETDASPIIVTAGTGTREGMYKLTNADGVAIYLWGSGENSYGFSGYKDNGERSWHYLVQSTYDPVDVGTVQGITPNGTVINMFDYWLTDRISVNAGGDYGEKDKPTIGINSGHALKFTTGGKGTTNTWTGNKNPRKNIVQNKLVDGYPYLTQSAVDNSGTTDTKTESLAYLFDPTMENPYKKTFQNVGGLLQIDETGYYYYNSQKNFAELDEETGQFTLYNDWGIKAGGTSPDGQFFPFNKFKESRDHDSKSKEINHYFGMTMTSRFVQRHEGHTDSSRKKKTVFEFSGDDDVWIFIDDVLIGDLGGIHDAASISIDFSTGDVKINGTQSTTLKQAFANAGKEGNADDWSGSTFADNTYHTLKFYYLERGNTDSNMSLQYNLTAVPATGVYKVNQYGEKISGVEFSVYRTDENWNYSETDKPVYTGTTDANGEMVFVNKDNMPYTLKELRSILGDYCVLKETLVPDGYRLTSKEIRLEITDKVLLCRNTYDSGAWSTPTLQIAAPGTLELVTGDKQLYYDDVKPQGTLFAVVLKRREGKPLEKQDSWDPVSGSSMEGYIVNTVNEGDNFIKKAIKIAQEQGNSVFSMAASGAMELTLEDLPGDVTEYYHMLDTNEKENTKYTIAYYWTSASSLANATIENTIRVNAEAGSSNSFDRIFGATIEVPNLSNRLLVQKFNEDRTERIDGAKFALYRANEDGSYIADNGSSRTLTDGKYTIDEKTGVIKCEDGITISPVEVLETEDSKIAGENGTAVFGVAKELTQGCYYVREIAAPAGYMINPTPVMARVTMKGIYANAGKENDGVIVGRGPGYIASTLHKAASEGQVDNTLTWIYEKMRVSGESNRFTEMDEQQGQKWPYLKDTKGGELTTYLEYIGKREQNSLFNYAVNIDRYADSTDTSAATRRIYTDVGWSYYEIYQDTEYGKGEAKKNGAHYDDLSGKEIANLFSRSTYIQMSDSKVSNLEISKIVVDPTDTSKDKAFSFRVQLSDESGAVLTGSYPYTVYNVTYDNSGNETGRTKATDNGSSGTIQNGDTLSLKHHQVAVIENLPCNAKYTVTEIAVEQYSTTVAVNGTDAGASNPLQAEGTLVWEPTNNITTVAFTNTYHPPLPVTLKKVDTENTKKTLPGAKFVLYQTEGETKKYYSKANGTAMWITLEDGQTEESLALTTDENGVITFQDLPEGKYSLKEVKAPDGYNLLKEPITFTVSQDSVRIGTANSGIATAEKETITVKNNTGFLLPQTGGMGTALFYIVGGILTIGAGILLVIRLRMSK